MPKSFLVLAFLLSYTTNWASPPHILHIKVLDAATLNVLPSATVIINEDKIVVTTIDGLATVSMEKFPATIEVRYVGYEAVKQILEKPQEQLRVKLRPNTLKTDEVIVESSRLELTEKLNTHSIDITSIKLTPSMLGTNDVMKSVQLLPGVSAGSEGSNGFFVRGGGIDQNLILLDFIPIYNASHFFGFFSMFNPEFISGLDFYKGGFPASLGGRVSSILRVRTSDQMPDESSLALDIGLLYSGVSGKLKLSNNWFLQGAARRSYIDIIAHELFKNNDEIKNQTNSFFNDFNLKISGSLSDKDQLSFLGFRSKDVFRVSRSGFSNRIAWSNFYGGVKWKRNINSTTFLKTTAYTGTYDVDFNLDLISYNSFIKSGIRDFGAKWKVDKITEYGEFTLGLEYQRQTIEPNNFDVYVETTQFDTGEKIVVNVRNWVPFLGVKKSFGKVKAALALRWNNYGHVGPFLRVNGDGVIGPARDTIRYKSGTRIASYSSLEPHFKLSYELNDASALSLTLDRSNQFIHRAVMSAVSAPTDVWLPSTSQLRPQQGDQVALGLSGKKSKWQYTSTIYYKRISRLIEYDNGVLFGYGTGANFDDNFVFGKGRSFGIESNIKGTWKSIEMNINYTLSKSDRTFPDINNGRRFPARYDRRHNLNLSLTKSFGKRKTLSMLFIYMDGVHITMPTGRYVIGGNVIADYDTRNNVQMIPYHRMDVAYNVESKSGRSTLSFGLYNAYNRANAYYMFFDINGNFSNIRESINSDVPVLDISAQQISLFPVLPFISLKKRL